jgi:molybdenum cofactor cytidylyltransferase
MTGIIILAAGSSSRLGKPKQNLVYEGKNLLQRAIETAHGSAADEVIVVLGANAELILPAIQNYPVHIVKNEDWSEGMASSIRAGIKKLMLINPRPESIILMLCDQPFVDAALINQLILHQSPKKIVACAYNNTAGPPVLFDRFYVDELLLLKGQEGAKRILTIYRDNAITIPFPLGSVDVDTMEDYEKIVEGKII